MRTRVINIGNIKIGGENPILVQSMTNTKTSDIKSTINQIHKLEKAGCEIIRCSVPDIKSAEALSLIKKNIKIPLVADIHFDYKLALLSLKNGADKIRINPGNMKKKEVLEIVKEAKSRNSVIRIGVNSGSLPELRLKTKHDDVEKRADLMVQKAGEFITDFENLGFKNIIVSLKSSDVETSVLCYKNFSEKFDYPTHVGITESGSIFSGSIKSSIGLGLILKEKIGNTIRVSLSSDPVWEVRAGFLILQALGLRKKFPNIISCPTCSRTTIDVIKLVEETEKILYSINWSLGKICPIKIAIMGCVVNGPGEAREADIGICGAGNKVSFFKHGKLEETFDIKYLKNKFVKEINGFINSKH
jgi:(E)-4-hydroxy-3-methylbut-2-enyl-diphosphate synthase